MNPLNSERERHFPKAGLLDTLTHGLGVVLRRLPPGEPGHPHHANEKAERKSLYLSLMGYTPDGVLSPPYKLVLSPPYKRRGVMEL